MRTLLFLLVLGFFVGNGPFDSASVAEPGHFSDQLPPPVPQYDRTADALLYDSLRLVFGQNKVLPEGYELEALRALSHYPELREVPVSFIFRKNPVAHTSRPRNGRLLGRRDRRHYLVIISTQVSEQLDPGRLPNLSYNARIGVLGHELAHTVDYLDRSLGNLIGLGLRYATDPQVVERWERFTDSTAVRHNLGYQLRSWSEEVHPILEKAGRGQNYLRPEEITAFMRTLPAYQ
ncbi:MAG: hypothetical protein AAGN35_19955 [Bacteroidota bacterium]